MGTKENDSSETKQKENIPKEALTPENLIYSRYTNSRRRVILLLVASSTLLLPMTDTIYLPSIDFIQTDLDTTAVLVSATISAYTAMVGVMPLFWGPLADFIGRKKTLLISLVSYIIFTILCIFSPNIGALIAFRAIEAGGVAALIVVGSGVIADIYPPAERGPAFGIFGIPPLIGPIVGPILGGAIAAGYNWRGVFIFLAGLAFILFILTVVFVPETLHYIILTNDKKNEEKTRASEVGLKEVTDSTKEEPIEILIPKPTMQPPWQPLLYLRDPMVAYCAWFSGVAVSVLYVTVIILPTELGNYYGLTQLYIGLCYLPFGVGALVGSSVGGKVTEYFFKKYIVVPESQLVGSLIGTLLIAVGGFAFGWTTRVHLSLPLIFTAIVGFGLTHMFPGVFNYCVIKQPMNAGGITATVQCIQFALSAVIIIVGQTASEAIGNGPLFSILCSVLIVSTIPGIILLWFKLRWTYTFSESAGEVLEKP